MYIKRYFNYQILYFISWRMVLYSMFTGLLAIFTYRYLRLALGSDTMVTSFAHWYCGCVLCWFQK